MYVIGNTAFYLKPGINEKPPLWLSLGMIFLMNKKCTKGENVVNKVECIDFTNIIRSP